MKKAYVRETTDLFDVPRREFANTCESTNSGRRFVVAVKERAVDGKANRAIEKALAEHFGVSPSSVRIITGHASREKTVDILL